MRTTGQYRVFSREPDERALSIPRHLLQEGRESEAEAAYRDLLENQPELRIAWAEYFHLLREGGRFDEALHLAQRAEAELGPDALAITLRGAALVELGRYREGLAALELAAERNPNLGLVWHEAGYAAFRLGEYSRALLALDRAFALEPHGTTLHLRGRILRQAGRYLAAEVAFGSAAETADYPEQRSEADRQIGVTRRFALFGGSRPDEMIPSRRWFAETGSLVLAPAAPGAPTATEAMLLECFLELIHSEQWCFTSVVCVDQWEGSKRLAEMLGIPIETGMPDSTDERPLVTALRPAPGAWERACVQLADSERGLSFVLQQPTVLPPADIAATLNGFDGARPDLLMAIETARHPDSRVSRRILRA
ncbi:MAG: tetratricopeptide repeat protein [Gemmatimonadota bacterium]